MKAKKIIAVILHIFRRNKTAAKVLGVKFGEGCKFIGNPVSTFGSEPWAVNIGDHVEITNGVQIITHDGALWVLRQKDKFKNTDIVKRVSIGNNVFIGVNSVILGGVSIGDNVIIGAGSVVNRDIPDNVVAAGVPAKVIEDIAKYEEKKCLEKSLNTKGMNYKDKQRMWKDCLDELD